MVEKHGHHTQSTWGIGRDHPAPFWKGVIRQLIARGAVQTGAGEYATLELNTDAARPILRSEAQVMLRTESAAPPPDRSRAARARTATAPVDASAFGGAGAPLFDALKAWRAAEAKKQSVPPYVIFHDSVLREVANIRPASLGELAEVKGVGASKLTKYGAALLAIAARG